MASPQTPSARKTTAANTPKPAKGRSTKATPAAEKKSKMTKAAATPASTAKGTKRKTKTETVSPKDAAPKGKSAGAKKQKVEHEEQTETVNEVNEALPASNPNNLPTPFDSPIPSTPPYADMSRQPPFGKLEQASPHNTPQQRVQMQQPNAAPNSSNPLRTYLDQIIFAMPRRNPDILPQGNETITSSHIDRFSYAVFQVCLTEHNGELLTAIAKATASFDDVKIRALGIMNVLPSWWHMRERFLAILKSTEKVINDSEMENQFSVAYRIAFQWVHTMRKHASMMANGGAAIGQAAHVKREEAFAQMSPRNGAPGMGHFDGLPQRSPGNVPVRRSHVDDYAQMNPQAQMSQCGGSGRMGRDEGYAYISPGNAPARNDDVNRFGQMSPGNAININVNSQMHWGNGHVHMNQGADLAHMSPGNAPSRNDNGTGFAQMSPGNGPVRNGHGNNLPQLSLGSVSVPMDHGNEFLQISPSNGPVHNDHGNDHAQMHPDNDSFDMGDGHDFAQIGPHDGQTTGAQAGNDGEFHEDEQPSGNF